MAILQYANFILAAPVRMDFIIRMALQYWPNGSSSYTGNHIMTSTTSWKYDKTLQQSSEYADAKEERLRLIIYVLDGYITAIFVVLGVLFNMLSMAIFRRMNRGKFSLAQYYLMILLLCQSALLGNCFLIYCLPTLLYGDTQVRGFYAIVIMIAHAFSGPFYVSITWIVLALTIERYFALCKPLRHRAFASKSRVKHILIGILVAAFIFTFPRLFEYKLVHQCLNSTSAAVGTDINNNCSLALVSTELLQNEIYWNIYHMWIMITFVTLTPSLIVLILTLRISWFLHSTRNERHDLRAARNERTALNCNVRDEREPNIMLIMIVTKFALSDPLPMAESVLGAVAPEESPATSALIASAANFLVILCNSINFLIFFLSGRRFRCEFNKIVCARKRNISWSSWFGSDEIWIPRLISRSEQTDGATPKHSNVSSSNLTTTKKSIAS